MLSPTGLGGCELNRLDNTGILAVYRDLSGWVGRIRLEETHSLSPCLPPQTITANRKVSERLCLVAQSL